MHSVELLSQNPQIAASDPLSLESLTMEEGQACARRASEFSYGLVSPTAHCRKRFGVSKLVFLRRAVARPVPPSTRKSNVVGCGSRIMQGIFLSYASEDVKRAARLRDDLVAHGLEVWFDRRSLLVGRWKSQIRRAILRSRYFVFCLSHAALRKIGDTPGFQDDELSLAFEIAQEQDERSFTIIPVRFDDCGRGDHRVTAFQQFDLFDDWDAAVENLSIQLGGNSKTVSTADKATIADSDLRRSLLFKAQSCYATGRFEASLSAIDAAISLSTPDKCALNNKGVLLAQLLRFDDSVAAYEAALRIDPTYTLALGGLAGSLVSVGRNRDAMQVCSRIPRGILATDARLLATASGALIGLKRYQEALQFAELALAIQSDLLVALANKAAALGALGRFDEGMLLAEQVLKVDPNYHFALNTLGACHQHLGRNEDAMDAYLRAIKICPSHWLAHQNIGALLKSMGRHKEALETFLMLQYKAPNHGYSYLDVIERLRQLIALDSSAGRIATNPGGSA